MALVSSSYGNIHILFSNSFRPNLFKNPEHFGGECCETPITKKPVTRTGFFGFSLGINPQKDLSLLPSAVAGGAGLEH